MERKPFEGMSLKLWQLHSVVSDILAARLVAKREELERRLGLLNRDDKPLNS
jgi:DNA-binding protein H-NS